MFYLVHFTVYGLDDRDKVEKLKKAVMGINGVRNVEITGRDRFSITYNPTKVVPSLLTATMNSVGIKSYKG